MKFLLVIPALMLFLSNIPFVHKMDMKEMVAAMKETGCCKKEADEAKACHAEMKAPVEKPSCGMAMDKAVAKPSSCHGAEKVSEPLQIKAESQEKMPCGTDDEKCPLQEATCVCICCFQYAAPDQATAKLQFGLTGNNNKLTGYLQQNWKDPHLTAPWQPPDLV